MNIAVIVGTNEHYNKYVEYQDALNLSHEENLPWKFVSFDNTSPKRKESYERKIASDHVQFFFATMGGEVCGFVLVQLDKQDVTIDAGLAPRKFAWVESLYVHPGARNAGVATLLMEEAEEWAKEKGMEDIELNVFAFNEVALEMYKKTGYSAVNTRMRKLL